MGKLRHARNIIVEIRRRTRAFDISLHNSTCAHTVKLLHVRAMGIGNSHARAHIEILFLHCTCVRLENNNCWHHVRTKGTKMRTQWYALHSKKNPIEIGASKWMWHQFPLGLCARLHAWSHFQSSWGHVRTHYHILPCIIAITNVFSMSP